MLKALLGIGLLVVLTVVGGALFFWWNRTPSPVKAELVTRPAARVTALKVADKRADRVLHVAAVVEPLTGDKIVAARAGRVIKVYVEEGTSVDQGEPMIRLDDTALRTLYYQLQMQLSMAQARLQWALMPAVTFPPSDPFGDTIPSVSSLPNPSLKGDRVDAEVEVQRLLSSMETLYQQMKAQTLLMPKSGRLEKLSVKVGDWVKENTVVAQLAPVQRPTIKGYVAKATAARLKTGQTVEMEVPLSYATFKGRGAIKVVQTLAEASSGRAWVQLELMEGNRRIFEPGQSVELLLRFPGEGGVLVPQEAIHLKNREPVVFRIVTRKGRSWAIRTPVQTGETEGEHTEVTSGLSPGDRIVLTGPTLVKQKQEIVVVDLDALEP